MKIYFAGSIRSGRGDHGLYSQIIGLLSNYGEVLTEHIGDSNLSSAGETEFSDEYIYERDLAWLKQAEVIIAEVSTPSLGVGYELGRMESEKPILGLWREQAGRKLSAMVAGNKNFRVEKYRTIEDVAKILLEFFKNI